MRTGLVLAAAAALAVAAAAFEASAAPARTAATTVRVVEKEFTLVPKPASVRAGRVTFVVRNAGKIDHEFVVLKTNRPAGKLPMKGTRAAEPGKQGEISKIKPGKSARLVLNLKPGKYVLLCNFPAHYKAGQYSAFTVR